MIAAVVFDLSLCDALQFNKIIKCISVLSISPPLACGTVPGPYKPMYTISFYPS